MVVNREKKEDVFAGFHIDEGVADNEESLNQLVENEQKSVLSPVDRDAFAEFNLDEIVRETEERLRKQEIEMKAKEEDEDGLIKPSSRGWESARAATSSLRGIGALRRPPQFLSHRAPIKGLGDIPSLHHLSSRLAKRDTDRNVALGDDSGSVAPKIKPKINPKKQSSVPPLSKKKKAANASRSGTTVTASIREEDESDSDNDSLSDDDDVEKGGNIDDDDDDDDDDSVIIVRRSKKQKEKDAITRSSTGMPIGGMLASSRKRASNSADSDYRWISPHKADAIFSDFDIDKIVKDYEEFHRTTDYGVPGKKGNGFNDDDDDEDDEQVLGIRKRYRSIKTFWLENFPRTHGVLFRILIPLLFIGVITWFLGIQLAHFEKGQEIDNNNELIRNSYNWTNFDEQNLNFIADGPVACFDHYMKQKVPEYVQSYNRTDLTGLDFPLVSPGVDKANAEDLVVEINTYMQNCSNYVNAALEEYKLYKEREVNVSLQSGMTFNWIRCWDQDDPALGKVNPVYPNKRQINAAVRQPQFFEETWHRNQSALYDQYIAQNYTKKIAQQRSVAEASGAGMCDINKSASAWFWFVFMTTVGYGNVSPVTEEGRLFVALIGWITVIVWAVILYVAGRVLGIIFDDVFRRLGCRKLTGNLPSVIFWGTLSILYIIFVGEYYVSWFNGRAHPGRVRFTPFGLTKVLDKDIESNLMTIEDAYWFSYISLLTVGLGDFSIGPESFFVHDLIGWTTAFLGGFTLIATFLGQIADLVNAYMPESGDFLKERLLNTNLVGKKEVEYKRENQKGMEKLEKIVEIMDDDDAELLAQRVTRIRVKQNLLVHLLHQTKAELDHYQKRGERYEDLSYAMICMEENMLNDVTATTRKEREKIESYRREGSAQEALPPPGSGHSYFDDGAPVDLLAKKLKLREGQKSAKKTLKASWYV